MKIIKRNRITGNGEELNYSTGDITQTITTTNEITGSSSETRTGRYSTLNNDYDATRKYKWRLYYC